MEKTNGSLKAQITSQEKRVADLNSLHSSNSRLYHELISSEGALAAAKKRAEEVGELKRRHIEDNEGLRQFLHQVEKDRKKAEARRDEVINEDENCCKGQMDQVSAIKGSPMKSIWLNGLDIECSP